MMGRDLDVTVIICCHNSSALLTFVDDDNWPNPAWAQISYEVTRDHPGVEALGGINEPGFEPSCRALQRVRWLSR